MMVPSGMGPSLGPFFRCSPSLSIAYLPAAMSWVQQREQGMYVNRAVVVWADGSGRILWQSDSVPAGEWLFAHPGGYPRPLGTVLHLALVGSVLAVAPSDSARIWLFDRNGHREVVQLPSQRRRAPTKAEYSTATRLVADGAPAAFRDNTEKNLLLYKPPTVLPAFYGLWGDGEGVLWVQMSAPGSAATELAVVKPGVGVLGRVTIARDVWIQEIGKDHITAMYDDNSAEPHVAVYRLIRR
jgi:hypothetical protein